MERLNMMDWISGFLAAIGGMQLGLIGLLNYNLLNTMFPGSGWYRAVMAVIGLAVLYLVSDVWFRVSSYETRHSGVYESVKYRG
jgi:uncharacterized membrane protein YuzA (DUF378 family)